MKTRPTKAATAAELDEGRNAVLEELKPLLARDLQKICADEGLKKSGTKAELKQRIAEARILPEASVDRWATGVSELFAEVRPGHSAISMQYRTRFNMVDQFDRDFYSQGPKGWSGSVFGKWLLDLLFLAKNNAYARFLAHSNENDAENMPISFEAFTTNLTAQMCEYAKSGSQ